MIKVGLLSLAAPPLVATTIAAATEATPMEYGVVGLILIIGLIPILKWMMRKLDEQQAQAAKIAENREKREDRNLELLSSLVTSISVLNENSRLILAKLESLPRELALVIHGG